MNKLYIGRRIRYRLGGYRKRDEKRTKFRLYIIHIALFMLIISGGMFMAGQRVSSLALRLGEVQLENQVRSECNRIAAALLYEYGSRLGGVVNPKYGAESKINSVSVDFTELNSLKCELTDNLTEYLSGHNEIICNVPIGALFSEDIFAAQGAKIPIKMTSAGSVGGEYLDDFTSGGINQTRHRLMLRIEASIQLHTVCDKSENKITIDIPITETVTVGDVPSLITSTN